jgi:hypothetical protein
MMWMKASSDRTGHGFEPSRVGRDGERDNGVVMIAYAIPAGEEEVIARETVPACRA